MRFLRLSDTLEGYPNKKGLIFMTYSQKLSLFSIFFVSFGGCLYGYNIGAMAGVLLFVHDEITLTHTQASLFVGSFLAGIALIMPIMGYLADTFGRKRMLLVAAITTLFSILFMALAHHVLALILARLITGIAAGMLNITIPLYLAEILPEKLRGRGTVAFQLWLCSGIFFATLLSLLLKGSADWRLIFIVELIPAVLLLLNLFFVPESPRWLLMQKQTEQALAALKRICSTQDAEQAVTILQKNITHHEGNFFTIFTSKKFLIPCLLTVLVASLNQLTGINVFLQYDATILANAGFANRAIELWGSVLITGINLISTGVAIVFVDRLDRRLLLRIGLSGVLVSLVSAACASYFLPTGEIKGLIITFALFIYIASFALGPGALVWTLLAEILPTKIRSLGLAISLCVSSLTGAIFSSVFFGLESLMGLTGIFVFCTIMSTIYLLLTFKLPATSGRSLEEIERGFAKAPRVAGAE
jgi:sugar porter (SP) family MFS transporter